MLIQLDLFDHKTESDILRDELKLMHASNDKLRKSLYSRHTEQAKKCREIEERLAIIERHICKVNKLEEVINENR
jgi:hypothetical protein